MEQNKLEEKLDELYDMVWTIKNNQESYIAAQKEMCTNRGICLAKVEDKIYGNGKPGILSNVQEIQKELHILKFVITYVILPIAGFLGVVFYNKLF